MLFFYISLLSNRFFIEFTRHFKRRNSLFCCGSKHILNISYIIAILNQQCASKSYRIQIYYMNYKCAYINTTVKKKNIIFTNDSNDYIHILLLKMIL